MPSPVPVLFVCSTMYTYHCAKKSESSVCGFIVVFTFIILGFVCLYCVVFFNFFNLIAYLLL